LIKNIILVKTNVDPINPQEDVNQKDKLDKSKENDNNNNMLKTEKKDEKSNSLLNVIKENIKEENKDKNINYNNKEDIEEKKEEDDVISYLNSQGKLPENEIKNSSKLILEELDGNLFRGQKIEIDAGGMVGGRGKKDGFTIFGQNNSKKEINSKENNKINNNNVINNIEKVNIKQENEKNHIFKNDFELNYSENLSYPYVFVIYYKKEEKSYYIRAFSGKGSDNKILFIRLKNENKLILKQKELISAGDTIFQITPLANNNLEIIHLSKKKSLNNLNKQTFNGTKKKIVTLGRSKDCDFSFPRDKAFSRFQTSFEFNEDSKLWTIIDGKGNKSSTNGTWVFGTHSFLIKNEMIVEILNSKIKIREIKDDKNDNIKESHDNNVNIENNDKKENFKINEKDEKE
jgi:hypothetical protein